MPGAQGYVLGRHNIKTRWLDGGCKYLEFSERQTKKRTGENPRDIRTVKPKHLANMNNPDRCPIIIYKKYAEIRPTGFSEPNHPFFIATTTVHHPSPQEIWFKRNPVGVNKLSSMMKQMVERAGLNPDKNSQITVPANILFRSWMISIYQQTISCKYLATKISIQLIITATLMKINTVKYLKFFTLMPLLPTLCMVKICSLVYNHNSRIYTAPKTMKTASNSSVHVSGRFQSILMLKYTAEPLISILIKILKPLKTCL